MRAPFAEVHTAEIMEKFFALLIGVGGDLPVTVQDAMALSQLLANPTLGGFLPENVVTLFDDEASAKNIINALDTLIQKSNTIAGATAVVYYSGHGLQFPGNTPSESLYYLKTSGADLNRKEETMLSGEVFTAKINAIKADRLLVLLDCCHADGIKRSRQIELEHFIQEDTSSNRLLLENLSKGEGRVFISACDDDEQSVILPGSKNSLFTEVCLEVMQGKFSPADTFISVIDLLYFVVKEVPRRVQPFRHTQRPIISEVQNLSPDYVICRNGSYQPARAALEDFMADASPERLSFLAQYDHKI